MSIESGMPSNHLILSHPLLLLPPIFPSIRVFPNESVLCIRWPKDWNFSFNISPSNVYSALISFRMDWLDLLQSKESLKSLLQHHCSKASIQNHARNVFLYSKARLRVVLPGSVTLIKLTVDIILQDATGSSTILAVRQFTQKGRSESESVTLAPQGQHTAPRLAEHWRLSHHPVPLP